MKLLILFIILNIVNVILQTIRSICTIKCSKLVASLVNALAYGLYTIVLVYTMCDLPLFVKAIVVALCNFVGVYVVKLIEEKARKDKLWKIEVTVPYKQIDKVITTLEDIPYNSWSINSSYTLFNFYCATQAESQKVKDIVKYLGAKYFVSETKTL